MRSKRIWNCDKLAQNINNIFFCLSKWMKKERKKSKELFLFFRRNKLKNKYCRWSATSCTIYLTHMQIDPANTFWRYKHFCNMFCLLQPINTFRIMIGIFTRPRHFLQRKKYEVKFPRSTHFWHHRTKSNRICLLKILK